LPAQHALESDNQVLYNGREWKDIHNLVRGHQFLFSDSVLSGTVFIKNTKFEDILLKYDIYNDEIITPLFSGGFLQLNREMVDSFYLCFNRRDYRFSRLPDMLANGYFNLLYEGKSILAVKYSKFIKKRAVDDTFDKFLEERSTCLLSHGKLYEIRGRRSLIKVFPHDREMIRNYLKNNSIQLTKNEIESFIPVLRYIDGL
jgi:hypothetical protein